MTFVDFLQLLSRYNDRVFIAYDDPAEESHYDSHIYTSVRGRKLRMPKGFKYDKETNTINSTSPNCEIYNVTVDNIYNVSDIDAEMLAKKIYDINYSEDNKLDIYGDPDSNIIYCDESLINLILPLGFEKKNPRMIVHGDRRYKYVNTMKYKITNSYSKYSNNHKKHTK